MKIKIFLLILSIFVLFQGVGYAETFEGKTIRIESFEGTVKVISGAGKEQSANIKMRIFDGYSVMTASDSTAYLSLDNTKAVKMDQNTKICIVKKDAVNEVQVISGSVFFSVAEKLKENESLNFVTPTMSMGIRGTTGLVSVKEKHTLAQLYSGKVNVTNKNGITKELNAGEEVEFIYGKDTTFEIKKMKASGGNMMSFALNEINNNETIKKEIEAAKVFNIKSFSEMEKENRKVEEKELKKEEKTIQKIMEDAEKEKDKDDMIETDIEIEAEDDEEKVDDEGKKQVDPDKEYELITADENRVVESSEGIIYIFKIDEKTGIAEIAEEINFSGSLEIINSDSGKITLKITDKNGKVRTKVLDKKGGYTGGLKIID